MKNNLLWRAVVLSIILSLTGWSVLAQQSSVSLPMVASGQVPLYPPVARHANVEGVVHLKITQMATVWSPHRSRTVINC